MEWKKKCRALQEEIDTLKVSLNRLSNPLAHAFVTFQLFKAELRLVKTSCSENEAARDQLQRERDEQKLALEQKEAELAAAIAERSQLEAKWQALQEEKDANEERIGELERELELLAQDNRSLEETVDEARGRLQDERKGLEEKNVFLHFTQEQLNLQVRTHSGREHVAHLVLCCLASDKG
jgi:chromosome segregation ATPase